MKSGKTKKPIKKISDEESREIIRKKIEESMANKGAKVVKKIAKSTDSVAGKDYAFEALCKRNIAERKAKEKAQALEKEKNDKIIEAKNKLIKEQYYEKCVKIYGAEFTSGLPPQRLKELVIEREAQEEKEKIQMIISLIIVIVAIISFAINKYFIAVLDLFLLVIYWGIIFGSDPKPNEHMICPHCKTKGQVFTQAVTVKKGIDGGKATAAVLTGGISVLATGLSGKENQTKARCGNCGSIWHF